MTQEPITVLCPGQGAQAVGMGQAWYEASDAARSIFDHADSILGERLGAPITELCFNGPADTLNRTDVSQPAIYVASVASWRGLLANWGLDECEADLTACGGLSLGEYTALHVSGALPFEDGLELVTLRGRAMQDAAEASDSAMVAIIGADEGKAREVCEQACQGETLVCANFNAPGQVVLSGVRTACERASTVAQDHGLRATMLPVAGAFHSPIMASAADRLHEALANTVLGTPRCPVASNVSGKPHEGGGTGTIEDSIRSRLVEQLTAPVRWEDNCRWLIGLGAACHELAPGRTLAGLMRRIDRGMKVNSHDTPE